MTFKLFKSTWTWRSLAQQDVALSEYASAPAFIDDDRGLLIRPTTRKMNDIVVAAAMPVFAQTEADLTEFLNGCKKRGVCLMTIEEAFTWRHNEPVAKAVKVWRQTRRNGSSKRGGLISGANRNARVREGAAKIKDRWKLPNGEWPTAILLQEASVSLNSIKGILGSRPMAQANYQAALKRAERRKPKVA